MDMKKFNIAGLQKYTSPQAMKDLDAFLDNLPTAVGLNALLASCFMCVVGGAAVWFAAQEAQKVSKLHAELVTVQALQPPVPVIKYTSVKQAQLKPLGEKIAANFKGVSITGSADGEMNVSVADLDYFPQFLAAISYIQRGGKNWKVKINTLCAGRDCKTSKLAASLKVETVTLGDPGEKSTPSAKGKDGKDAKDAKVKDLKPKK